MRFALVDVVHAARLRHHRLAHPVDLVLRAQKVPQQRASVPVVHAPRVYEQTSAGILLLLLILLGQLRLLLLLLRNRSCGGCGRLRLLLCTLGRLVMPGRGKENALNSVEPAPGQSDNGPRRKFS